MTKQTFLRSLYAMKTAPLGCSFTDVIPDFSHFSEDECRNLREAERLYPLRDKELCLVSASPSDMLTTVPNGSLLSLYNITDAHTSYHSPHHNSFWLRKKIGDVSLDCLPSIIEHYWQYHKAVQEWMTCSFTGVDDNLSCSYVRGPDTIFRIYDGDTLCAMRRIEIAPFESFVRTGEICVCGSSWVKESVRGQGLARRLYACVERVIPYRQIPHGMAGAPFKTSKDGARFWEGRMKHASVPKIKDNYKTDYPVSPYTHIAESDTRLHNILSFVLAAKKNDSFSLCDIFSGYENNTIIVKDNPSIVLPVSDKRRSMTITYEQMLSLVKQWLIPLSISGEDFREKGQKAAQISGLVYSENVMNALYTSEKSCAMQT